MNSTYHTRLFLPLGQWRRWKVLWPWLQNFSGQHLHPALESMLRSVFIFELSFPPIRQLAENIMVLYQTSTIQNLNCRRGCIDVFVLCSKIVLTWSLKLGPNFTKLFHILYHDHRQSSWWYGMQHNIEKTGIHWQWSGRVKAYDIVPLSVTV